MYPTVSLPWLLLAVAASCCRKILINCICVGFQLQKKAVKAFIGCSRAFSEDKSRCWLQGATLNDKAKFLCQMVRWHSAVRGNCKWLRMVRSGRSTRLPCKVVSKLIAFSWQIHQSKYKGGTRKETLTVF